MPSLKNQLLKFISNKNRWVHNAEIEDFSRDAGFLGGNGSRRCRELVNEGKLIRKIERGVVLYKVTPTALKTQNLASQSVSKPFDIPPKEYFPI